MKKETESKVAEFLAECFAYYLPEFYSFIHWLRKHDKRFAYEIFKRTFYKDEDVKWEPFSEKNTETKWILEIVIGGNKTHFFVIDSKEECQDIVDSIIDKKLKWLHIQDSWIKPAKIRMVSFRRQEQK